MKNHWIKRTVLGALSLCMTFSIAPQVFPQNNIYTVEAATVKLSAKKITLEKGKSKQLTLKHANGKVRWKSNKKTVATVAHGLVRAKKSGKATITATYNNKKYKCTVIVTDPKFQETDNSTSSSTDISNSGSSSISSGTSGSTSSGTQTVTTVYWTPSGEVYHQSQNCASLSRSKTIYSGSISNSGKSRACKVCF
jgi:hypothetical protein